MDLAHLPCPTDLTGVVAPDLASDLVLTRHGQARLQQRGIPRWFVDALLDHGRRRPAGGGAEVVAVDKPTRQRLSRVMSRPDYARAERYFNVYAVVAPDGALITAARWQRHAHRPNWH